MRFMTAVLAALVTLACVGEARAAPIQMNYTVVGQPILDSLGITFTASGGASTDTSNPLLPVVTSEVTAFAPAPGGELIESSTSLITADYVGNKLAFYGLLLHTGLGLLFSDLEIDPVGPAGPTFYNNWLVATVAVNGDVSVSGALAGLLDGIGLRGTEGFVLANVQVVRSVPEPGALLLSGLALAALAAVRFPRRAATSGGAAARGPGASSA